MSRTPIFSCPAAPEGNLAGLTVSEFRTGLGVYYVEVSHQGCVLLNCRTEAVARALTCLEGVDWRQSHVGRSDLIQIAVPALMAACQLEGVSYG